MAVSKSGRSADTQEPADSSQVFVAVDLSEGTGPPGRTSPKYSFLIIGSAGAGKSSTGNTILGYQKCDPEAFKTGCSYQSITVVTNSKKENRCYENDVTATFTVVDTPNVEENSDAKLRKDWNDKTSNDEDNFTVIYVIRCNTIYSPEDKKTYLELKGLLPDRLKDRIIIGFTFFDEMDSEKDIRDILIRPSEELREVLSDAQGRYVIFDNKADDECKRRQVAALVDAVKCLQGNMKIKIGLLGDSEDVMMKIKERVKQNLKSGGFIPEIDLVCVTKRSSSPSPDPPRMVARHHVFLYVIEDKVFQDKTNTLELLRKINKGKCLEVQRRCIIVFAVDQPVNNDRLNRAIKDNEVINQLVTHVKNRYVQIAYSNGDEDIRQNEQKISRMVRTLVKENYFSQCSFTDTTKAKGKEIPNKDKSRSRMRNSTHYLKNQCNLS